MFIRAQIEAIVNQLSAKPSFNYANKPQQNYQGDNIDYTNGHVTLIEIEQGELSVNSLTGGFYENNVLFLQFVKKTEFDYLSVQNDDIVEEMKLMAKEFITRYNKSGAFEQLEKVKFMSIFNQFDVNVTGVELQFTAKEIQPEGMCL